jgi:hypothetical protein
MNLLSRLLLTPRNSDQFSTSVALNSQFQNISRLEFDELMALANSNHVVVRGLELFLRMMREAKDDVRAEWAETALAIEHARISTAVSFLHEVCTALEDCNYDVVVIKSLDHWPDLGSDLDLFTNASSDDISELMRSRFDVKVAPRSWGDRLSRKWNFLIPGLPEAVEIHMGRLGQTGEQVAIASRLSARARLVRFDGHEFRVPSTSDRLLISTLQRMYRHFYFRLCDIIDSAELIESSAVDYVDLRFSARQDGIWEGVATYLAIVSDYVMKYGGSNLNLPQFVISEAHFGGDSVFYGQGFLRVPIMPQSAKLYGTQLAGLLGKGEVHNSVRLSLLPWLATAAAIGQKITGSDKGIW